ncbi:hypothetical protein [Arthrobacter sp. Leaf137]|uniref:hypothetical protein n=1 Tax=Arthrobacter sp. Leaf137 TaxID=1736271 RepID=UPI0006FACEEA|nr:hypothetical protein [Arthrobacter sp. Leaf137]KQQ80963.1 hypothetical protein ASF64_13075 [Arthrobacter sp. Leaf137]
MTNQIGVDDSNKLDEPGDSNDVSHLERPTPITRAALWLHKRWKFPMWGIYTIGFLAVVASWAFLAWVMPEGARPLINVAGCGLLALGGLFAAISKSEPLLTGRHESDAQTHWRSKVEDASYIAVVVGGLFVLVAAVRDPAAIASWHKLWHLW